MNTEKNIERFFSGRKLVIATKHQKEQVIQPILEPFLGVECMVPANLDTDDFGTFSGEVERLLSPLDTARNKCIRAHQLTRESLVIASEGSFGAHPVIGYLPANEEIILLKDFKNDFEIKAKVVSTQTNFAGNEFFQWDQLLFFCCEASFPSHGLILRPAKKDFSEIHKGVHTWDRLKESFQYFKNRYGKVYVETDMRAMYNPTRMKVIEEAVEKLMKVISECCPTCGAPGFSVQRVIKGLPCKQCNSSTPSTKAMVYVCQHCGHSETKGNPEQKEKEDPVFCNVCNP